MKEPEVKLLILVSILYTFFQIYILCSVLCITGYYIYDRFKVKTQNKQA